MRLFVLAICSLSLLVLSSTVEAGSPSFNGDPLSNRTFQELGCKGVYDNSILARLDRICMECYNFHRDYPQLYNLCRQNCFSTVYFPSCLQSMNMHDEQSEYRGKVLQLGGKGFDILPYPTTMSPSGK